MLTDLYDPNIWRKHRQPGKGLGVYYTANGVTDALLDEVVDWAGLNELNPFVTVPCLCDPILSCYHEGRARHVALGALNDNLVSFEAIADIIDAQL